jgi:hypothetical protein
MGVLLMALFLVNLPFVHETWIDREVDRSGKEVQATVLDTRRSGANHLLDYQLPRSVDPDHTRYSARVDAATYELAQSSHALLVRVVPGKPSANRPAGEVTSHLFLVVAILGDSALLVMGLVGYRRWRHRSQHVVVAVDGDDVTLASALGQLTAVCPPGWAGRLRAGQRVTGGLHLVTDRDVLPGGSVGGFEQQLGSSYVVRGRVVDARAGRVDLELEDRSHLRVETGPFRIRADIRDPTEIHGTLCFTPTRG